MPVISDDPTWEVYNTHTYQGATWRRTFTWTDATGVAVDLTGATATLVVRKVNPATYLTPYSVEAAVISISSADGEITFVEASGMILCNISDTKTAAATPGLYNYELEVDMGTDKYKVIVGIFEVRGETTV